jgi:hypothetical protein
MIGVECTDYGQRWRLKKELLRKTANVFASNCVDARKHIVKPRHVSIKKLGFANVTHSSPGVLLPQDHRAAQLALGAREFCVT